MHPIILTMASEQTIVKLVETIVKLIITIVKIEPSVGITGQMW